MKLWQKPLTAKCLWSMWLAAFKEIVTDDCRNPLLWSHDPLLWSHNPGNSATWYTIHHNTIYTDPSWLQCMCGGSHLYVRKNHGPWSNHQYTIQHTFITTGIDYSLQKNSLQSAVRGWHAKHVSYTQLEYKHR